MIRCLWRYSFLLLCILQSVVCFAQKDKQEKQKTQDFQLANEYFESQRYEEGIKIMEDLIADEFNDSYYKTLLSAYKSIADKDKQEKLIKKAIKKSNNAYYYIIDLGCLYLSENDSIKADKQFLKAVNNLSTNNSEIIGAASYFTSLGLYDYTIKTYQKGRQLLKNPTAYTYELSYIYQIQGRNEEIIAEYLVLLEQNPNLLNQVEVNINNLVNRDKDNVLFAKLHETLLDKVKENPNNEQLSRLYLWSLEKEGNYSLGLIQAKAIDKRFDKDNSSTVYYFACDAMNNKEFSTALKAFDYITAKPKEDPVYFEKSIISKMECKYLEYKEGVKHSANQTEELRNEYKKVFSKLGYNSTTANLMQQYANVLCYEFHQPQDAVDVLDTLINLKTISTKQRALAKIDRADIYLAEGDIWEASLTYSQVSKELKNENEGALAKFKNAMLSYYTGEFEWALSQFQTLSASTSKLIANDAMDYFLLIKENIDEDSSYNALSFFSKADFLVFQNKLDEAEAQLNIIETSYLYHPIFDEVLYKKAEIAYKQKDYEKADSLWNSIVLKYPYDIKADDAIFNLAKLNEEIFQRKQVSINYYQKIILEYPSSLYISQARKKYEELSSKNN